MGYKPDSNFRRGSNLYRIMENIYTYKRQGNGLDSWVCECPNGDKLMVYEDPNIIKKINCSTIDIDSITDADILKLKTRLGL